jgi:hypothetical protein
MEGQSVSADGVQMIVPGALNAEGMRIERRRAYSEIGLTAMERECRSVMVGKRRLKAWRVPGTPEFSEHARLVGLVAEAFSGEV